MKRAYRAEGDGWQVGRGWRLVALAVVWVAAIVPIVVWGWLMIGDRDADQREARLQLAELTAAHADGIVGEAFHEVDLMATEVSLASASRPESDSPIRGNYARHASFSSGVLMVDDDRQVVFGEPNWLRSWPDQGPAAAALEVAAARPGLAVSLPFVEPFTGHVVTALSVPVFADDGSRAATMVGLLDLTDPLIADLIEPAHRLGPTGHADLVDETGVVLASTNPDHIMATGDHPEFYERMAASRHSAVEVVSHSSDGDGDENSAGHLMAYAPLRNAPWGMAIGAETHSGAGRDRFLLIFTAAVGTALALSVAAAVVLTSDRPHLQGDRQSGSSS